MARGSISQSAGHGKKISVFPFDVAQEVDGRLVTKKVDIEVYMQSKFGDSDGPDKPVVACQFYLRCEGFEEWGTDLNVCLQAMRGRLDKKYQIKWERWLLVKVTPARIYRGTGAGTELSWTEVERGVTLDGSVLMREYDTYADFRNRWKVSPWPEVYKDSSGKAVACVPATEDNVKALEAFATKLRELTKTLAEFVAPDRIEETLAQIANGGLRLLGGPSDE